MFNDETRPQGAAGGAKVPAAVLEAALSWFADPARQNPGAILNVSEPFKTRGIAGTWLYNLRIALAEKGVYTTSATWPVAGDDAARLPAKGKARRGPLDPNQPFFGGLTRVAEADYSTGDDASATDGDTDGDTEVPSEDPASDTADDA